MTETTTKTYCVICDSTGDCGHNAARYLDDIVYEEAAAGWTPSETEKERWNRKPIAVPTRQPVPDEIPPLQRLVVELEAQVFMDSPLEMLLRSTYELDAGRTASTVAHVVEQTKLGKLRSPGGLLVKKLREIEGKSAA